MTFLADGGCYNSSRVALDGTSAGVARDWQAASGTDVTGWDHADIAIYASSFDGDDMNSITIAFKLQWREVGSGTWLDLASTGDVKWGTSTTLTQGNAVTSTEGSGALGCGGMTGSFGSTGDEVEGTNQSASRQRVKKEAFDIQWALDFSDAASLTEYEFRVLDSDNEVCSSSPSETTITTQVLVTNPIITDVDTDENIGVQQTAVVITGSSFGTQTGSAKVEISPNNTYAAGGLVLQTINSWASDTSILFDVVRTGLSAGTNYVWVTDSTGAQNTTAFPITLTAETPSITNIDGDDALQVNQTNIVIVGDGFYPNQTDGPGTGFVELATTSAATGGTRVTQSIDTWADQSIQFDLTEGGLSFPGTYFARVYNGDNVSSAALSISVQQPVSITNVDGDDSLLVGQLAITITGTGFQTSQGTGKIEISPNNTYGAGGLVEQTIATWSSDTSISFDLVRTGLSVGTLYLYVTNDSGLRDQQTITLVAVNPTVSSFNGGTQIFGDTTGIAVVGLDFGAADVGSAKVELGNASTYAGSGTKVEQTVTTWGGQTSITVSALRGALSTGTVYVYVTNSDGGVNTNGLAVTLSSVTPAIASLDGDGGNQNSSITAGETVTMTGSNFRTTQTTGKVEVCNNISYASATVKNTQTITAWADTQISFTVNNVTGLVEGTNYVFISNGTGEVS
jgi:hypothetical protein